MKVLIACEYSGRVRKAFELAGHTVLSCDFEPAEDGASNHYQGDVRDVLYEGWDLMVAHPPCTYLANSGVSHLKDPARWADLEAGAAFFKLLLNAPIPKKAIENPIMHKYAKERIGGIKQTQVIQPWMFGHMEQKATCLWLVGLPKLRETCNLQEEMMVLTTLQERQRLHYLPPSPTRWKERSRTYQGIASAMGAQWGNLVY